MSRKPEQKQWDYLSRAMGGAWDAQRHEDELSPDVPDVSYAMHKVDGWIELKTLPEWPKRASTPVRLHHLRAGQVTWLERRGKAGNGKCFLLLAVGEDMGKARWVLVPWWHVRTLYDGKLTREDLLRACDNAPGEALQMFLNNNLC